MCLTADNRLIDFQAGQSILINKPLDWTSFDVVNKIRSTLKPITGKIKVGHAGTLDPKAEGLLILCTGRNTKKIDSYQNLDKEYEGEIFLGVTTPSFDTETSVDRTFDMKNINIERIREVAAEFENEFMQTPPAFSAVKVGGEASYLSARRGEPKKLRARKVHIEKFSIISFDFPVIRFDVKCSKGTYIRSLADDLGKKLGGGAYLRSLKRIAIGKYKLEDAWEITEIVNFIRTHALSK